VIFGFGSVAGVGIAVISDFEFQIEGPGTLCAGWDFGRRLLWHEVAIRQKM
jgi:hypothetical protein